MASPLTESQGDHPENKFPSIMQLCRASGQEVHSRCPTCGGTLGAQREHVDKCTECGQDLPDESDTSSEEADEVDTHFKTKRDRAGVKRVLCKLCDRKLPHCPRCKQFFDIEDSEEESTDSDSLTESEENDEEEQPKRKRWKL